MTKLSPLALCVALAVASTVTAQPASVIHHAIVARIDPAHHRLEVQDEIVLPDGVGRDADGGYRFLLHAGLAPEVTTAGWRLQRVEEPAGGEFIGLNASTESAPQVEVEGWRLVPPSGVRGAVQMHYGGTIDHPLAASGQEYQRGFSETPGIIDSEGVFLAGASFWVPTFGDELVSFQLEVSELHPPWDVVSQGRRIRHEEAPDGTRTTVWRLAEPTEEIYLVAGPWHEYAARAGKVETFAFLREADPTLADTYLKATARYLALYDDMLPPYPYPSFSLVENFWETGYGMPGFTLLGPRIIRFPWILTSSYPHELLHNWWGNSVYVDYASGNWCEGLTAYGADHLFAEQRGEGASYRRATLQKYTDFVSASDDIPLTEFRARHSAASEAVGYGKALMVFHMVRRAVGDEAFLRALSTFWERNRFRRASFSDLARAFSDVAGGDWGSYFTTWTTRTGAPRLEIAGVDVKTTPGAEAPFAIRLDLRQVQEGEPFPITVPVAVTMEGRSQPLWVEVGSCRAQCSLDIHCPARPLRLDVDPAFDVMRRLDPLEVPPALSTLFGASDPLYVLPAAAPAEELEAWRELAAAWARPGTPRTALDRDLDELPRGAAWILGRDNRFGPDVVARLSGHPVAIGEDALRLGGEDLPRADHSLVLVARAAGDPASAVGWVAAAPASAIGGLARKLPHYTRYSYLGFAGPEPTNVVKGTWQPLSSPLVRNLSGGELPPLELEPRAPLAELPPASDPAALADMVKVLAGPQMEGRGLGSAGLERATAWVEERMAALPLQPAGQEGFRQSWTATAGEPPRPMTLTNLLGRLPGKDPRLAHRPVVVMAHLDHLGLGWPDVRAGNQGLVHPGADDNASGVAALLAVAELMASEPAHDRPVLFAVVTGEEAGRLGSRHLLEGLRDGTEPMACVNLDTVGRLGEGKILVLDAGSAREWPFIFAGVGYTTGAPVEVTSQPLDSSDQASCIERGVPAVQLFTGPNADYHRPSDTADKIDPGGLATVVEVTRQAVAYLADRREPLTGTGDRSSPASTGNGPRRASLGTVPDFGFAGPGVRVAQVVEGSPAAAAGILAADVVVALDGAEVTDLAAYARLLKAHAPGDRVRVTVLRDGVETVLETTLGER